MLIFRNRDIAHNTWLAMVLLLLGVVSTSFFSWQATIIVAICGTAIISCNLILQKKQQQQLAQLSEVIDQVLHGEEMLAVAAEEGELAILSNQIQKMTIRLREQADTLKHEKQQLAQALANVAHQVRTPLTTLFLVVDRLGSTQLEEKERQQLNRELDSLLKRIDTLVTELLKIAKLEAGTVEYHPQKVKIADLIVKAQEPFAIPLELAAIDFQVVGDQEATIFADITWTVEALGNLIKNALEHTPAEGKIFVSYEENALYTEILIQDSGTGIHPNDLPHIFERFYQGQQPHPGNLGIGLALARMIISQQNGSLIGKNSATGGAAFSIRFYRRTI